jgi:hypothetical protein
MSLLVTRCGFTAITLKPNNNPHHGKHCFDLSQESMAGMLVSESSAAFFFFIEALCSMNSLLKVTKSRILSGGSETSMGCCTKKAT